MVKGRRPECRQSLCAEVGTAVVCLLTIASIAGCAVHYYDARTGTEHIWGVGHMAMKVSPANEGVRAVIRGTSAVGLAIGSFDAQQYVSVGWVSLQRVDVIDESTAVRLEWPAGSPFNMRVGSSWQMVPDAAAKPAEISQR